MPGRITSIEPNMDLGIYLESIKTEYAAKGLGVSLSDPNELGMLIEGDLINAGIIKEKSYSAVMDEGSIMPKIKRSDRHPDILQYRILKISPSKYTPKELLEDNAKMLIRVLMDAGAAGYRAAAYEKDGNLFLVIPEADDEGNRFNEETVKKISEHM